MSKTYRLKIVVTDIRWYEVEANSEAEARQKHEDGESEMYDDDSGCEDIQMVWKHE